MLYHPCAVYIDPESRRAKKLFSYDSEITFDDAVKVINRWENDCDYMLICAFVQVYEGLQLREILEITNSGNPMEQYRMADDW